MYLAKYAHLIKMYFSFYSKTPSIVSRGLRQHQHKHKPRPRLQRQQKAIWRCLSCEERFDSPTHMICCDRCEEWYHSTCVGISICPEESQEWYCKKCGEIRSTYQSYTRQTEMLKQKTKEEKKKRKEEKARLELARTMALALMSANNLAFGVAKINFSQG